MTALKLGPWYVEVNMDNGGVVWPVFGSLQAFWPGMQALVGDLEAGAETIEAFYRMWNVHGAVPEGFHLQKEGVSQPGYPLRPELAESAMYMHVASSDPIYLDIGKQMVASLQTLTRVECGFASLENVLTKELADIMDSFFLAETCKYLFLLFDSDHWIRNGRYVFNTEGHPFPLRPGRPNMTAERVADWDVAIDTWLGPPAATGTDKRDEPLFSDSSSSGGTGQEQMLPSADRFVRLAGQCLVPGFFSRVASRGLNRTLLTSEDLIRGYLPEAEPEDAGDATANTVVIKPGGAEGLPDKIAEMAGQWMQQIFGKGQRAGAAGAEAGVDDETAAGSMAGLQEMMKTAGVTMSMGADGEITMTQTDPTATAAAGDSSSPSPVAAVPAAPATPTKPSTPAAPAAPATPAVEASVTGAKTSDYAAAATAAAMPEEARSRGTGSQQLPPTPTPPLPPPKPPPQPPHMWPTPSTPPTPGPAEKKEADVSWRDADSAASAATRKRFGVPPSVPIHKRPASDAHAQAEKLRAKVAAAKQARAAAAAAKQGAPKGDL